MSSPIDAWNTRYSLARTRLPSDIDELAVICCESEVRKVTHVGIQLENCIFNSRTLQSLRQRVAPGAKLEVRLRYSPELMDRIWVEDPVTRQRFEVVNQDPATKDLSAKQVALIESMRNKAQSIGTIMTRAQARKKIEEVYRPLLLAKTMLERRRAFKVLGLLVDSELPEKSPKRSKESKVAAPVSEKQTATFEKKGGVFRDSFQSTSPEDDVSQAGSLPRFKVVRHASTELVGMAEEEGATHDNAH